MASVHQAIEHEGDNCISSRQGLISRWLLGVGITSCRPCDCRRQAILLHRFSGGGANSLRRRQYSHHCGAQSSISFPMDLSSTNFQEYISTDFSRPRVSQCLCRKDVACHSCPFVEYRSFGVAPKASGG